MNDGLCLLVIFLPGEGVTLAQLAIEDHQNEITVAPTLLSYINLRNKMVIGFVPSARRFFDANPDKALAALL